MPTTPNGTVYTVSTTTLSTHGECYWAVANTHASDSNIPTILYAHGDQGAANQFATLSAWAGLRNWLIDNGWAWIEGIGGADLGSRNWGNDGARAAYLAYLDHVDGILDIGPKVLLGRSMGGLVTSWLCARSGVDFDGWINNSGVSTLFVGDTERDIVLGKENLQSAAYWANGMTTAYGLPDLGSEDANRAQLEATQQDRAPENWSPSVWTGKNILCCYGDADLTVKWNCRGAGPLRDIWTGQPATDLTSLRPGGDHSASNGSYLDTAAMIQFLLSITGDVVEPIPQKHKRIVGSYLYMNGSRFFYKPR